MSRRVGSVKEGGSNSQATDLCAVAMTDDAPTKHAALARGERGADPGDIPRLPKRGRTGDIRGGGLGLPLPLSSLSL